jgi:hypothetical protein
MTILEVISIFLLWSKAFYFLRIWTETAYIAKMVGQVGYDMKVFLLITAIAHSALGQVFLFISMASGKYAFVDTIFSGFRASWQSGLGDFPYDKFNEHDNP